MAAKVSSSRVDEAERSTIDSVVVAEDTTESVQIAADMGSGEPDQPTY